MTTAAAGSGDGPSVALADLEHDLGVEALERRGARTDLELHAIDRDRIVDACGSARREREEHANLRRGGWHDARKLIARHAADVSACWALIATYAADVKAPATRLAAL